MKCRGIKSAAFLVLLGLCAGRAGGAEPFVDHGGKELAVEGPVRTPIRHRKYFVGEREQFGYNPRYQPGVVTFGPDKRPLISHRGGYLLTLDDAGRWIELDVAKAITNRPADVVGPAKFYDPHVGFDRDGDMYLLVRLSRGQGGAYYHGLIHSRDSGKTWRFYQMQHVPERLERLGPFNQLDGPPPVVEGRGKELNLTVCAKKPDGTLTAPKHVVVAKVIPPVVRKGRHWLTAAHSGCGNVSATYGGKTHIVWMSIQPPHFHEEAARRLSTDMQGPYTPYARRYADDGGLGALAPCYAVTYDHKTGKLSERTVIGFTRRDNHNGPVISVDSKGYLDVIIGSHNDNFQHTRSLKPNSTTGGWTEPRMFGTPRAPDGDNGYTYVGLVRDKADTLHVVARWSNPKWFVHLVYMRKKSGRPWEPHKLLVVPFRDSYSIYYHKLNMDRRGRLFVNYSYYAGHMTEDEAAAYARKWPQDNLRSPPGKKVGKWPLASRLGLRAHDPCMLISDDHADTWRLAVTEDFRP